MDALLSKIHRNDRFKSICAPATESQLCYYQYQALASWCKRSNSGYFKLHFDFTYVKVKLESKASNRRTLAIKRAFVSRSSLEKWQKHSTSVKYWCDNKELTWQLVVFYSNKVSQPSCRSMVFDANEREQNWSYLRSILSTAVSQIHRLQYCRCMNEQACPLVVAYGSNQSLARLFATHCQIDCQSVGIASKLICVRGFGVDSEAVGRW